MYDDLVNRLRTECTLPYATIQLMREAADAIKKLEKEIQNWKITTAEEASGLEHWFENYQKDVPRWIPVMEQLPEPGAPCLCWCKGGTYWQIRWYGLYYLTSHKTWSFDDNDYDNREVTHWMYRPEPPKEE